MTWPGITDFSEAIQNPSLCFQGTELESATVEVNQRGMPLVFSGAFASVYSVSVAGQTFAVRCFTREVKDQEARYNELSNYLINVLPPSFVHFEYLDRGICVKGQLVPDSEDGVGGRRSVEQLRRCEVGRFGHVAQGRGTVARRSGGESAGICGSRITICSTET